MSRETESERERVKEIMQDEKKGENEKERERGERRNEKERACAKGKNKRERHRKPERERELPGVAFFPFHFSARGARQAKGGKEIVQQAPAVAMLHVRAQPQEVGFARISSRRQPSFRAGQKRSVELCELCFGRGFARFLRYTQPCVLKYHELLKCTIV